MRFTTVNEIENERVISNEELRLNIIQSRNLASTLSPDGSIIKKSVFDP
jgi:hypothetical protein